jgi:putative cell wall-binding protein
LNAWLVDIVVCSSGKVLVNVVHSWDYLGKIRSCMREKGGGIFEKLHKTIKQ